MEIAIKVKIKIDLSLSLLLLYHIYGNNFAILDIKKDHIIKLSEIELFHKDPLTE